MNAAKLKNHIQSLLQGERPKRSKSQLKLRDDEDGTGSENERRSRPTTPGRALLEEVSLKPVGERNIKGRLDPPAPNEEKCEFKNHFKDFMKTPATVKRGRSFSQPKEKEQGTGSESLSRKESFEQKYVESNGEAEKCELKNHTQRFLKRKSMINSNKTSDESDTDSVVKDKPIDRDDRDGSPSDNDVEDSPSNLVVSKPPPFKTTAETRAYRRNRKRLVEEGEPTDKPTRRFDRRLRSKSDITVPRIYDLANEVYKDEEIQVSTDINQNCDEQSKQVTNGISQSEVKDIEQSEDEVESLDKQMSCVGLQANVVVESKDNDWPRVRRNNVHGNNEYFYLSTDLKVSNSKPKPFVASPTKEQDRPRFVASPTKEQDRPRFVASPTTEEDRPRFIALQTTEQDRPSCLPFTSSKSEDEDEVSDNERERFEPAGSRVSSTASSDSGLSVSNGTQSELTSCSSSGQETTISSDNKSSEGSVSSGKSYALTSNCPSKYSTVTVNTINSLNPEKNVVSKSRYTNSESIPSYTAIKSPTTETKYSYKSFNTKDAFTSNNEKKSSFTESKSNNYNISVGPDSRKNSSNSYNSPSEPSSRKSSYNTSIDQTFSSKTSSGGNYTSNSGSLHTSTSDIMNACKSGLRRLTYRKTYSKSRVSQPDLTDNNSTDKSKTDRYERPKTTYTQHSSGSRLPNRPTTPGPYLSDRNLTAGLYSPAKRPTTPGPFSRDSWKRTNQKFNYARILGSSNETYI